MFCDRCGRQLMDGAQFCGTCGKPTGNASAIPAAPQGREGRVNRNLNVLGSLWIAFGVLLFVEMAWIVLIGRSFLPPLVGDIVSGVSPFPGRFPLERIISSGLAFAGFWLGVFGTLNVVIGWSLLERQPWARIFCLIFGFLALLRFPFGTALGIYTIWVLLPASSGQEYDRLARAS